MKDEPATREKSDVGGSVEGRTSGIDTERNIACRVRTLENEWM